MKASFASFLSSLACCIFVWCCLWGHAASATVRGNDDEGSMPVSSSSSSSTTPPLKTLSYGVHAGNVGSNKDDNSLDVVPIHTELRVNKHSENPDGDVEQVENTGDVDAAARSVGGNATGNDEDLEDKRENNVSSTTARIIYERMRRRKEEAMKRALLHANMEKAKLPFQHVEWKERHPVESQYHAATRRLVPTTGRHAPPANGGKRSFLEMPPPAAFDKDLTLKAYSGFHGGAKMDIPQEFPGTLPTVHTLAVEKNEDGQFVQKKSVSSDDLQREKDAEARLDAEEDRIATAVAAKIYGNTKKNKDAAKKESASIKKDYDAGILLETAATRQPVVSMPVFVLDDEHVEAMTGATGATGSASGATGANAVPSLGEASTGTTTGSTGTTTGSSGTTGSTGAEAATGPREQRRAPIGPIVTGHRHGSASTGSASGATGAATEATGLV